MYAGYFPMGLSLERIFREMPNVPFKDDVWPKFLRENAVRVFGLERVVGDRPLPVPDPLRLVLRRLPGRVPAPARPRRCTTSPATSSPGATRPASSTCRTRSARISAPTSATAARCRTGASPARSTAGASTPRAPTSRSRTPSASTARPGCAPSRPSSATACPSPGTTPTSRSRRCGRCPSSRSSPTTRSGRRSSDVVRDRHDLAGDGRERRRLCALPLRAQHRDGAGARLATRPASRSRRCGRRRSSRRPAA